MNHTWSRPRGRNTGLACFILLALFAGRVPAQSLPTFWVLSNVGSPTVAGSIRSSGGVFSLSAAGTDIGGVEDQFSFVQQRLAGDTTIVARVRAPQNRGAKAGVMIRESLDAPARNLFAMITGSGVVSFQRRRVTGGDTIQTSAGTGSTVWLKIERRASMFVASSSPDGATWSEIGTEILDMPATVYVGLALTSANDLSATTVAFASVTATSTPAVQVPASPPQGWSGIDIGLPTQAGSESARSGRVTVTGGGSGLDGSVDQFHYMYRQVSGDVDLFARVAAVQYVDATTVGGLMVRDSLSPNGAHGSVMVQSGGGTAFQSRIAPGGTTTTTIDAALGAPSWVMLQVRSGVVTGWGSLDGANWTQLGMATPNMPPTFYVGVAVASTNPSASASAIFDNLTVNNAPAPAATESAMTLAANTGSGSTAAAAPLVTAEALAASWTSVDIGSARAGSTRSSNGTYTIKGAGGVWHTDQFRYMYQAFSGDVTITAHVVSQTNTNEWAKAGVSIREGLTTTARHTSMVSTPGHGTVFFHRDVTGQSPPEEPIPGGAKAPAWVRLERRGSVVTAFYSSNGSSWTAVGSTSMAAANMYVGLIVSSEVSTQTSTAVFDNVTVTAPTGNQAPTVSLTAPANGATFTAPATVTLSATASDADGSVSSVSFFAGATLIGTDTTSPYSVTWNNVAAGSYSLTAVATDNAGAKTTSAARSIAVSGSTGSPTAHAVFTASRDHNTLVIRYQLDIFRSGSNPNTATPVATKDLGKPAMVNGDCDVDITQTVNGLAAGSYIATVSAIGSGGSSRSAPASFTK